MRLPQPEAQLELVTVTGSLSANGCSGGASGALSQPASYAANQPEPIRVSGACRCLLALRDHVSITNDYKYSGLPLAVAFNLRRVDHATQRAYYY